SLGKYHINLLAHNFQYIDAVSVDTPILADDVRQSLQDCFRIRERLARSFLFLKYLNSCSRSLQDARAKQVWNDVHDIAKAAMAEIDKDINVQGWDNEWEVRPSRGKR